MVNYTLKNRRKKTMKRKTVTKRRNIKRKTGTRKGAGTPGKGINFYRKAHSRLRGRPSAGEQSEIDAAAAAQAKAEAKAEAEAAAAAKAKMDLDELTKIRQNPDYTEMKDINDLEVGTTYVKFQGADASPVLKDLGQFIKTNEKGSGNYGLVNITLEFQYGVLSGFHRQDGPDAWMSPKTGLDNVFKVNSPKNGSVGGRKKKTRKNKNKRQ